MPETTDVKGRPVKGGCQCGSIRYSAVTVDSSACACHCRMCQKASGQPFMAFVQTVPGSLRWTRGAPAIFRSSSIVERAFCRECGTPVSFEYADEASYLIIGTLDDPRAITPAYQCGVESALPWCLLPLPQVPLDPGRFINFQHPDNDT